MELVYIIAALALAVLLTGGAYLLKRKGITSPWPSRGIAIAMMVILTFRYLWAREAIYPTRGLNMYSPFGSNIPQTILGVLLVWFTLTALICIFFDTFFKFDTMRCITRFFAAPVLLLDLVFFKTYAISISGVNVFSEFEIRTPLIAVEIALGLALVCSKLIQEHPILPNSKTVKSTLFALPFVLLSTMPAYALQALVGFRYTANLNLNDITEEHRVVLYFAFIIPFLTFHALKNKNDEVKRFVLLFMSFAFMWTFMSDYTFATLAKPWNWPLHLCHTAMFIVPLCLAFKLNKLYYFSLFINVMGALFAMLMPNTLEGSQALATHSVIFWVNHYAAFFMPILVIALKAFKRPQFKEWVYSLISFTVYFVFVLVINAWFANYDAGVDFFFLNSDFIADKLGQWAENLRNLTWTFTINDLTFKFYPIYQALFYIVYVAISLGIWFIYAILFISWDAADDRRLKERDYKRMKKDLLTFLGGKPITEPISGDDSPRIQLKGFSKRYGNNKHYSVENACLDVHGGEIFGFLGPNGAGKSTIIKSIVGIQTITSGNIEICGYDVEKQPVQSKLNLGFVPDHYALYENLTGREYINYIADLYQVSKEERDATIEHYVSRFQLTGSFDNQMKTYSHGMKQKIAIMAALVHNPKVWILDEPLTGLDPTSIHEVKECMKEHAAKGNIVFFSSHIIDVVEKICDRIAIIKKGKIRVETSIADLDAKGIELEQFYLETIYGKTDSDDKGVSTEEVVTA